jgi:hypothetical protein
MQLRGGEETEQGMQQRIISDIETCNQQRDIPPRILLPRRARAGRDLAGRARSATPECDLRARGDRSRPLHPGRLGGPHGCIARPAGSSDWSARLRRLGAARRRYDCGGSRPGAGPHQDRAIVGRGARRAHIWWSSGAGRVLPLLPDRRAEHAQAAAWQLPRLPARRRLCRLQQPVCGGRLRYSACSARILFSATPSSSSPIKSFELLDIAVELLRGAAEARPTQHRKLRL